MNPAHTWHYGTRFEELVRAMLAVDSVWDELGREQRRDLLTLLLPGVTDVHGCWAELADPLGQLDALDGVTAVDTLQQQGWRAPNTADAMLIVGKQLRREIAAVISQWRAADQSQPTTLALVTNARGEHR